MEYETYPSWVPNLDGYVGFVRKLLPGNELMWFERTLIYAARVLNASKMGSQSNSFLFNARRTKHVTCRVTLPTQMESRITHPYPNFLFLHPKGTPSFPPVFLK